FQGSTLMRGVAFDGLDQIGNEIMALFELNVDVGKRLVGPLTHCDEAVVDADRTDDEDDNNAKDNPAGGGNEKIYVRKAWQDGQDLAHPKASPIANGRAQVALLRTSELLKKDPEPEPGVS